MRVLILLVTACQAWQHFLSFNDGCAADLSLLRGTQMEMTITGGRLPYQFKHALDEVLKERIRVEGCEAGSSYDALFGLTMKSVLRFLDSSDTSLASTTVPAGCDSPFSFSWKKLKQDFPGVVLPSSCKAADFQATGKCQVKFKLLDDMFIELVIQENCNNDAQPGFHLPSFNFFCSGSLCDSFARPCSANTDCGAGVTCDSLPGGSAVLLVDALRPLIDLGLFNNLTDFASCSAGANSFQEKFWSGIINAGAHLLGLTPTISTAIFNEIKLCGIAQFTEKIIPTNAPTPIDTWLCDDHSKIPATQVCDGFSQCPGGDDELLCTFPNFCSPGYYSPPGSMGECCPVCTPNYYYYSQYCSDDLYCGSIVQSQGNTFLEGLCTSDSGPINCSSFMLPSSTSIPNSPKQTLSSASTTSADQHVVGWADCSGNVQIGSPSELGVINARLPIHKVAAEIEKVISSVESCRGGTKPPTASAWGRYFYPWATSFWGGLFFADQGSQNVLNDINPGAKLDADLPYYSSGQAYTSTPPYANVANAPDSCNLASTTGATPSCELHADISSWFAGPGFPVGWSGPTTIKAKVASTCLGSGSSAPSAFLTCDGKCDATSKSGCCLLRNAIVRPLANGNCAPGYHIDVVDTGLTDFIFNHSNGVPKSNDTTLVNFLALLVGHTHEFGVNAPFIGVQSIEALRSLCFLDGSGFDNNTEQWAKTAATEDCPVPASPPNGSRGCPQFIAGGGLKGCTTSCLPAATTSQCNPNCPLTPGEGSSPAFILAPTLMFFVGLGLFQC